MLIKDLPPISNMRQLAQLQTKSTTQDEAGQRKNEYDETQWTTQATRLVYLEPIGGSRSQIANQIQYTVSHLIVMRYYSGLTPYFRIKIGNRIFTIDNINNVEERNFWHAVQVTERV